MSFPRLEDRKHSSLCGGKVENVSLMSETDNNHMQSHRSVTVNSKQMKAQNQSMIVEDMGDLLSP